MTSSVIGGSSFWNLNTHKLGYDWAAMSRGPEANQSQGVHAVLEGNDVVHDPANGTVSVGAIICSNKGMFDGTPGH